MPTSPSIRRISPLHSITAALIAASSFTPAHAQLAFTDATAQAGLANITAARLCFADLNNDTRPDAVIRCIEPGKPDRYRVFLNTPRNPDAANPGTFALTELTTNLPAPAAGDCLVFADLNNDGTQDAIITRYLDVNKATEQSPLRPERTAYALGKGDGTFNDLVPIAGVTPATTAAVAVGDIDRDGLLDLYLGNWYTNYGESVDAFENQILRALHSLSYRPDWSPEQSTRDLRSSPDAEGRPTYGVMIVHQFFADYSRPSLLELNYGRRANRVWNMDTSVLPRESRLEIDQQISWDGPPAEFWFDITPDAIAGDADRSGTYPAWLTERAKTDPRFAREDEQPFRSHGNTFDAAVGDIDNDGDFDLFLTEITHAWAGPSSDRSRFIIQNTTSSRDARGHEDVSSRFVVKPELSVDRIPQDPTIRNWNQGDLFAELADFDNDTRLDLLLSSGDYPDDERLRLYRQQDNGTFEDITPYTGLSNEGSQQISLADVDLDGDVDIMVGQSFNRLSAAQVAGRTPTVKLYLNQTIERRRDRIKNDLLLAGVEANALTLLLQGDPAKGCNKNALGAVLRVTADTDGDPATPPVTQLRQLIGIGGHAGKQHELLIHVGLGAAKEAHVDITWPSRTDSSTTTTLTAGRHTITQ